eukprot:gnl/Chilomastix_caulleri/3810.p1 GENE.gnl/Chilomastix_caulleri/3810~~gnl/Chilomastix_caulleri/3810.p1  ORF type:complete len:87 (+),score=0.17 gnl/Chilomastix_caulleri/3810:55-315(+)
MSTPKAKEGTKTESEKLTEEEISRYINRLNALSESGFTINQSIFKLKTLHQNVIEKYRSRIHYLEKLCRESGLEIPKPSRSDIEMY